MATLFGTPALYTDGVPGGGGTGGIELLGTPALILHDINENQMVPVPIDTNPNTSVGVPGLFLPLEMHPTSIQWVESFGYPSMSTPSESLEDPAELSIDPEFWMLPVTGNPVRLMDVGNFSVTDIAGSRGAVSFDVPVSSESHQRLMDETVGPDRDVLVEIRLYGSKSRAMKAYITDSDANDISETERRTFTGAMVAQRMYEAVVWINPVETTTNANGTVTTSDEVTLNEPEKIRAARAIRDKAGDHEGDDAFSDETWKWTGCPAIVTTWAPILRKEWKDSGVEDGYVWLSELIDDAVATLLDKLKAAKAIKIRFDSEAEINSFWNWEGSPPYVEEWHDVLHGEYVSSGETDPSSWLDRWITNAQTGQASPVDPGNKGEIKYEAKNAGQIISDLVTKAKLRGCLTEVTTTTFNNSTDSAGIPWKRNTTITLAAGTSYGELLEEFEELELCEWELTSNFELKLYNLGTRGRDLTANNGPNGPIVLKYGRDILDSSRKHSVREGITSLLVAGKEGLYKEEENSEARNRRRRRIEGYQTASNIEDANALAAFAQAKIEALAASKTEISHSLVVNGLGPQPYLDISLGDTIYSDMNLPTGPQKFRVQQISLQRSGDQLTSSITVGTLSMSHIVAVNRKIDRLLRGSAITGVSTPSPSTPGEGGPEDVDKTPAAPTGVVGSSPLAYVDTESRQAYATAVVGWAAVVTNADGTPTTDIEGYRVRYAYINLSQVGGDPLNDPFSGTNLPWFDATVTGSTSETSVTFGGLQAGATIRVEVQAFDGIGQSSAWSEYIDIILATDDTAPQAPSGPQVSTWFNSIRITWNGLDANDGPMPIDFECIEIHVSQVNDFTPDSSTYVDTMRASGTWTVADLVYDVGYFVRFVAVDTGGNKSDPSATSGPWYVNRLVNIDFGPECIDTAQIRNLAVGTAQIMNLAVNDLKVETISVAKLIAGVMSADVIIGGNIMTSTTGRRMRIDSSGWTAYKADGATIFARLDVPNETMLMTGTYQSGLFGERIWILPDGTLRFYGAAGVDFGEMANVGASIYWTSRKDEAGRFARVLMSPTGFRTDYGTASRKVAGFFQDQAYCTMNASANGVRVYRDIPPQDGFENRMFFVSTAGTDNPSGDDAASVLYYYPRRAAGTPGTNSGYSGNATDFKPVLRGVTVASGILFDQTTISIIGLRDSDFGPLSALTFNQQSSGLTKTAPTAVARLVNHTALSVVSSVESRAWQYLSDLKPRPEKPGVPLAQYRWDEETQCNVIDHYTEAEWGWDERPAPWHFGPIAEDLEAISEHLVFRHPNGTLMTNIGDMVGILWAAVAESDRKWEARFSALEAKLARTNVIDVEYR